MVFTTLEFLTLIAGFIAFVVKFFYPTFPLDGPYILSIIVAILGSIGIVPQLRAMGRYALGFKDIISSMAFWTFIGGILAAILHYYVPTFPITEPIIVAIIVWILSTQGINPTLYKLMG